MDIDTASIVSNTDSPFMNLHSTHGTPFNDLNVTFFVDTSGSTKEKLLETHTILQIEQDFVKKLCTGLKKEPKIVSWNTSACPVNDIEQLYSDGGTAPHCIFGATNTTLSEIIRGTEIAVIITDGEISGETISLFGDSMTKKGIHFKAIIGVIVGRRSSRFTDCIKKPTEINVSVLAPGMISHSCIILHNSLTNYVMWSSGCFKSNLNPNDIDENTEWDRVLQVSFTDLLNIAIPQYDSTQFNNAVLQGYIPFGDTLINLDKIMTYDPSWDEFIKYPFDIICRQAKIKGQSAKLREFFKKLREKFIRLFLADNPEELSQAINYIQQVSNQNQSTISNRANTNISSANYGPFCSTRDRFIIRNYIDDVNISTITNDPRIIMLCKIFTKMMSIVNEDSVQQNVGSSYSCASISSSRYNYLDLATQTYNSTKEGTFVQPVLWLNRFIEKHKYTPSALLECTICYETSVPFFLIRQRIQQNKLIDVTSNPFEFFYPQHMCCKCAEWFCSAGCDPVRVKCFVSMPIVPFNCLEMKREYLKNFAQLTDVKNDTQTIEFIVTFMCGIFRETFKDNADFISVLTVFENSMNTQ
jgi:hypothetical protein